MIALLQLLGLNGLNVLDLVSHLEDGFVPRNMAAKDLNMKKKSVKMPMNYVFNQRKILCLMDFNTVLCLTTQKL